MPAGAKRVIVHLNATERRLFEAAAARERLAPDRVAARCCGAGVCSRVDALIIELMAIS